MDRVWVTCRHCGNQLDVPSRNVGQQVRCPICQASVKVVARASQTRPASRARKPGVAAVLASCAVLLVAAGFVVFGFAGPPLPLALAFIVWGFLLGTLQILAFLRQRWAAITLLFVYFLTGGGLWLMYGIYVLSPWLFTGGMYAGDAAQDTNWWGLIGVALVMVLHGAVCSASFEWEKRARR